MGRLPKCGVVDDGTAYVSLRFRGEDPQATLAIYLPEALVQGVFSDGDRITVTVGTGHSGLRWLLHKADGKGRCPRLRLTPKRVSLWLYRYALTRKPEALPVNFGEVPVKSCRLYPKACVEEIDGMPNPIGIVIEIGEALEAVLNPSVPQRPLPGEYVELASSPKAIETSPEPVDASPVPTCSDQEQAPAPPPIDPQVDDEGELCNQPVDTF